MQMLGTQFAVTLESSEKANDTAVLTVQGQPLATLHKPSNAFLAEHQIDYLRAAADLQPDRLEEILVQTAQLVPFFGMVGFLSPAATRWTLRMTETVLRSREFSWKCRSRWVWTSRVPSRCRRQYSR